MNHIGRNDQFVKLLACQQAQFDGGFAQRFVVFYRRFLATLAAFFVANFAVQRGNEHQGMVQEIVDLFRHGFDAGGAVFVEAVARVAQEADGLQEVVGDNGHIDVQLKVARCACHADGDVVAEHLAAHHGHRFALGRVDFARP